MKSHRPSPALVVSVIALIVALSGTAVAAKTLITSSSQIKNGVVTGADVRNNSLSGNDIKNKSIRGGDLAEGAVTSSRIRDAQVASADLRADVRAQLTKPSTTSATEVVRARGPVQSAANGGSAVVATLKGLAAGSYLIQAKTVLASASEEQKGLLDAVLNSETHQGKCRLEAGDNADESMGTIITPASKSPANLHLQLTRTLGAPTDIVLRCESDTAWSAGGTSIVAIGVGTTTRSAVEG